MSKGILVPSSASRNYVQNQRGERGSYKWDDEVSEIGLGHQTALQSLNKQYSNTINEAYAGYLAANRGIAGSNMGQGYKDAYIQQTQQAFNTQQDEALSNLASAQYQLSLQGAEALAGVKQRMDTETSYINRTKQSAIDYYEYLRNLENKDRTKEDLGYFTKDELGLDIDQLYDRIFDAFVGDYEDMDGNEAMTYNAWLTRSIRNSDADRNWYDWLLTQGGLKQFRDITKLGTYG